MSDDSETSSHQPTVVVETEEGYDLDLNVNFHPGRRLVAKPITPPCQPRQGAMRVEKEPLDLPEPTRSWLFGTNKTMIGWLARSEQNRQAFLVDPIAAMASAGVTVERVHAKALGRWRESRGLEEAVFPGLRFASVASKAKKTGRVKAPDNHCDSWTPPALDPDDECGCDSGAKED